MVFACSSLPLPLFLPKTAPPYTCISLFFVPTPPHLHPSTPWRKEGRSPGRNGASFARTDKVTSLELR